MLEKLKRYFGLDGFGGDGQSTSSSNQQRIIYFYDIEAV